jgi:ketosteroid isomerase-like protein
MSEDAVADLVEIERAWMEALRSRDMDRLESILADEFTLTTGRPGAEVRGRREWLEVSRTAYVVESFEFQWIEARVYGEAALVRSRYRQVARMGDLDRTDAYLMSDVFTRRDGRWQAVARHLTPLGAERPRSPGG